MITVRQEIWDLFTGKVERASTDRDAWGRVPSRSAGNMRFLEAVVSRYLYQLGFRPTYPGGAPFAVCLSHDVDVLTISAREKFGSMRRGQLPFEPLGLLRREVDPRFSVQHLLDVEQRVAAVSSFYFMALEQGDQDYNYAPIEARDEMTMVLDAGSEIGLHGGHRAYAEEEVLAAEKQRLALISGTTLVGYRNHFLRLDLNNTWKFLERSGFVYDTTYGFSDTVGFRNGMCYPFRPIDPDSGLRMGLLELPLIYMDATVFFNLKVSEQEAWDLFLRVVDEVRSCAGIMTLLWHNNYMDTRRGALYERMLALLASEGVWFSTGAQMVEHWMATGQQDMMETLIDTHLRPN
ncbi:MAG: polysaccharide deacetylase family protein [Flavobacteriales bacterium]